MVLEALAAVGLAGNIAQFVDFSCQLFNTTIAIHRSYAGSSKNVQDVETITQELAQWCGKISSFRITHSQLLASSRQHQSLVRLATDCEAAAIKLLSAVHKLRAKDRSSKWESFKVALNSIWNESQIKDMENGLNSYRLQLVLELSLLQSLEQKSLSEAFHDLSENNRRAGADMINQVTTLRIEIRQAIEGLKEDFKEVQSQRLKQLPFQDAQGNIPIVNASARRTYAAQLTKYSSDGADLAVSMVVLNKLAFEKMEYRRSTLQKAHPQTLKWFLSSQFESWLVSPDPIFWISGKPGSGKSTLMKWLVDEPRARTALSRWAGSKNLVVADYFFWINGTQLQRSQDGLLRALLYGILCQDPKLLRHALPAQWQSTINALSSGALLGTASFPSPEWTRRTLEEAFQRLSNVNDMDTKFCIFIDGLDEYAGDHEDLIQTIRHLTKLDIKLCVASRPWNVFEDAFGSNKNRKLYLQDLNRKDIERYVKDKLGSQPNFQCLDKTQAIGITEEIVERSQGVFLWVRLVVRSLLEGLRNQDGIALMRRRLLEFPSDLDEFFSHMFFSLEKVYRTHLSHMFQVALAANEPISPIAYWFLDELGENSASALTMPIQSPTWHAVSDRIDKTSVRINGRCKGLLEVTTRPYSERELRLMQEARVDFLHRTVKDYLMTSGMQKILSDWQEPNFNPNLALCKVSLAELKYVGYTSRALQYPTIIKDVINTFFSCASSLEQSMNALPTAYWDEFERIFNDLKSHQHSGEKSPWPYSSFLKVAVTHNLRIFLKERLAKKPRHSEKERIEWLNIAISHDDLWEFDTVFGPRDLPEIIKVILASNPRMQIFKSTQMLLATRLDRLYKKLGGESVVSDSVSNIMREFTKYADFQFVLDANRNKDFASIELRTMLARSLSLEENTSLRAFLGESKGSGEAKTVPEVQATKSAPLPCPVSPDTLLSPDIQGSAKVTVSHASSIGDNLILKEHSGWRSIRRGIKKLCRKVV